MIYPCPKPPGVRKKVPHPLKRRNAKRKGRAFGASRVDEAYLTNMRDTMSCAICVALEVEQTTRTEVEHFVLRSHGGYDRGDTYPTCAHHRIMRHEVMGPKAFTRMLLARGFDERALCDKLATMYDAERWPCP